MTNEVKNPTVSIVVDGRPIEAGYHEPLLDVVSRLGINVPSLCSFPGLEPLGACRLCLVEVEKKGRRQLVAACTYPAEDGLSVFTATETVLKHRRMVAEVLLARAPGVPEIQSLAKDLGVTRSRFQAKDDTCILCGLCTRVCESYATSAIAVLNRGETKTLGSFAGEPPEDCVGCLACATLCPTGHIQFEKKAGAVRIWQQEFPLATAVVDRNRCRGCGACEAACPFSIPRVVLQRGGLASAEIDIQACRGCGVCLAACPTAAISQPRQPLPSIVEKKDTARVLVVACERSNLKRSTVAPLSNQVDLVELPCTGGVTPAMVLQALFSAYDGVLVLGRHQSTCRLNGAETHAQTVVERMDQLAQLLGLGTGRVVFLEPAPGPKGPGDAIREFLDRVPLSPLTQPYPDLPSLNRLEGAFDLLTWNASAKSVVPDGTGWLQQHGLPRAEPGQPALLAGDIPYLDILLGEWLGAPSLSQVLKDSLAVLSTLGIDAGVAVGGVKDVDRFTLGDGALDRFGNGSEDARPMNDLLNAESDQLKKSANGIKVALNSSDPALAETIAALGFQITVKEPSLGLGLKLALSKAEQEALLSRFSQADASGADALIVSSPLELIQYLMVVRQGAWQQTRVQPMLAVSLFGERAV